MKKVAGVFHVERRNSARLEIRLRVAFAWQNRTAHGETLDISETGLRLRANAELAVGARLILFLGESNETAMQRIEVEVSWAHGVRDLHGIFECGGRFVSLPDGALDRLRAIMAQAKASTPGAASDAPEVIDEADIVDLVPAADNWRDPKALDAALASDTERRAKNQQVASQLLKIAHELIDQDELDTAISVLTAGAQRVPDSADIIEELAQLLFRRGRVQESAALFDKALRIRQEQGS
ncbi:MAG: PilZ domain-containing protein [Deltaproteobacteria bacterium]|nr:PilZ domain-containing protein [Deltaproteobacteria bacterium]